MHNIVQPEEFHLHSDDKPMTDRSSALINRSSSSSGVGIRQGWYRATMSRAARWHASRVRLSRRARSIATIDGAAIAAIDGVDM